MDFDNGIPGAGSFGMFTTGIPINPLDLGAGSEELSKTTELFQETPSLKPMNFSLHAQPGNIPGTEEMSNTEQLSREETERMMGFMENDNQSSEFLAFLRELHKANKGTGLKRMPVVGHRELDLYQLFTLVEHYGGLDHVVKNKLFKEIAKQLGLPPSVTNAGFVLRNKYEKLILPYEKVLAQRYSTLNHHTHESPPVQITTKRPAESMPNAFALAFPQESDVFGASLQGTNTPVYGALKAVLNFFVTTFGTALDRMSAVICTQESNLAREENVDITPLLTTLRPLICFLSSLPGSALPYVFHAWPLSTLPLMDIDALDDQILLKSDLNANINSIFIGASPNVTGLAWPRGEHLRHLKVMWDGFDTSMFTAAIAAYPNLNTLTIGDARSVDLGTMPSMRMLYRANIIKLPGRMTKTLAQVSRQCPQLTILRVAYDPAERRRDSEPVVPFPPPGTVFPGVVDLCLSNCRCVEMSRMPFAFPKLRRFNMCHSVVKPIQLAGDRPSGAPRDSVATNCGLETVMPNLATLSMCTCSGQLSTSLPYSHQMTLTLNMTPGVHELPSSSTAPHRVVDGDKPFNIVPMLGVNDGMLNGLDVPDTMAGIPVSGGTCNLGNMDDLTEALGN
ncbi:ARID/BRIGHT DNA binding domain [Carpediemonas membranifera]|uniref:ARID/BRIGHT DNA binding domain n=1 Tax=Carpediemonas membranifera TaxID=201153 RepID=A0A8J6B9A2_9EUKA|nr:ARID/BRIGHT DNA binding domain [Carpediemonas membranifera]|eukprot:KAG9395834.1 ARID/BRIGHT DNA binding domain [Carpediemonas membranifera]